MPRILLPSQNFLGLRDVEKLKKTGRNLKIESAGKGGFDLIHEGQCPFLEEGVGCTLSNDLKPLDCILYPLSFTEDNGGLEFYLNDLCPYFNEAPDGWIEETKRWAIDALKSWTKEERKTYASRQIGHLRDLKTKEKPR